MAVWLIRPILDYIDPQKSEASKLEGDIKDFGH